MRPLRSGLASAGAGAGPRVAAEVAAITQRAMNGELDFRAALEARVALLASAVRDIDIRKAGFERFGARAARDARPARRSWLVIVTARHLRRE